MFYVNLLEIYKYQGESVRLQRKYSKISECFLQKKDASDTAALNKVGNYPVEIN